MIAVTNNIFRSKARTGYLRDEYLIWGFVRYAIYAHDDTADTLYVPKVMKEMILQLLGNLNIDSHILNEIESIHCMRWLNNHIQQIYSNDLLHLHGYQIYNVLFRGSTHGFEHPKFIQCCRNKNGTFGRLILIETEHKCVFGAYFANIRLMMATTGVSKRIQTKFLFTIRPNIFMKTFQTKLNRLDRQQTLDGFGFGKGTQDIYIYNHCNKTNKNWIQTPGKTYNFGFHGNQLCGGQDLWGDGFHFTVKEIECFEIL
eukprot:1001292_1